MPRVFLSWLNDGYEDAFRRGLEFINIAGAIKPSDKIVIKPNLTYPTFRQGVMTHPAAVEALIRVLRPLSSHITICESDSGGYNPFSMTEVFRVTGLAEMAARYGVAIANLSEAPSRKISVRAGLRKLQVPLPTLILDETDWFFSMPVPKVHLNTRVSLAMKNQWGVIQQPALRLKLHPYFAEVIDAITRVLPHPVAVMDGQCGLTRTGPMRGDVIDLGWTLVSDDLYACDYFGLKLMSLDYRNVPYLRRAFGRRGLAALESAVLNDDWRAFQKGHFFLKREWTDYPGLLCFKSRAIAYLGYESLLSKPLHWLLYRYREPFY
jgi:uncharacterized protein (DUF362 family)